ncbi:uncharacterized protein [Ptychodera flava]|uniref:uncharacterized protein n=1 Tax=Ptychodera flava TaxID=63121 RepID=UPI00396AA045
MMTTRLTRLLLLTLAGTLSVIAAEPARTLAKSNKSFFTLKPADVHTDTGHRRVRRSTDFTASEIASMLARHNYHRSNVNPEAADMKYMSWDDDLATMAQQWSEECIWEHGNPTNISPFSSVGQNLWMGGPYSSSASIDVDGVVDAWNDEVNYYDYDSNGCSYVCGHYTQVVWASTYAVGCGIAHCTTVTSSTFTNAFIVTCNYGPAGNYPTQPFVSGSPCTKCASGIGQCYENQCRLCSEHSEPCECNAVCHNCGTLTNDCTCTCQDGWYGSDCDTACENTHHYCGANPGWYDSSTCSFADYVPVYCPLMCGICNAADPNFVCEESTDNPTTDAATTNAATQKATTRLPPSTVHGSTQSTTDDDSNGAPSTAKTTNIPIRTTTDEAPTEAKTDPPPTTDAPEVIPTGHSCDEYLTCENGGTFSTQSCTCTCTDEYEGDTCQYSKEQATFGVRVLIYGDVERFSRIESILHRIIAYILNRFCNVYFSLCCPGRGTRTSNDTLTFVVQSDINTADGYPVDYDYAYWVMLYVQPQQDNALCADGSESRRRRDLVRLVKRDTSDYLSQDTLKSAIEENVDEIESSLNVTVGEIESGGFETSVENTDGLAGWAVALIVVSVLLVVAAAVLVGVYFLLKKTKPEFMTDMGSMNEKDKSASKIELNDNNANVNGSNYASRTSLSSLRRNKVAPTDELE